MTQPAIINMKPAEMPSKAASPWRFAPLALIAAGLALGYALGWHHYLSLGYVAESREALKDLVGRNYILSLAGFCVVYVLAVALAFPAASVLTIFAGFLFGWMVGGMTVAIAATTGASILFLAARSAFGGFLRQRVSGTAKRFAKGFREDAFSYLLVLRLAPVFPFVIVNIAPALFDVKLRSFIMATLIGILPGTFAYAYLGQGVDSVLVAAQKSGREASLSDLVTWDISLAFIALAIVATIPLVVRKLRARD